MRSMFKCSQHDKVSIRYIFVLVNLKINSNIFLAFHLFKYIIDLAVILLSLMTFKFTDVFRLRKRVCQTLAMSACSKRIMIRAILAVPLIECVISQ